MRGGVPNRVAECSVQVINHVAVAGSSCPAPRALPALLARNVDNLLQLTVTVGSVWQPPPEGVASCPLRYTSSGTSLRTVTERPLTWISGVVRFAHLASRTLARHSDPKYGGHIFEQLPSHGSGDFLVIKIRSAQNVRGMFPN